mmetsp:Transcript_39275/g.108267  ORF Transcript_39275/g.108267 Transcript_39275/m.108267 type:complete len:535 (+) Transcript_39275:129-1733(+)
MNGIPDVRYVALPCVLLGSLLQYWRFAKKPMAAPCHRLTDRFTKRCVFVGLAAELSVLFLLPLCEAYPMNASCLVCLYFWKETKRSKSMHFGEVLACASALSAWILPFVDPADGRVPEVMEESEVLDMLMAPRTCLYVVGILVGGIAMQCQGQGASALGSTVGPALNFGVSAMFLKALAYVVASIAFMPSRPALWGEAVALVASLLWVRSAAAAPLRRALETHDKLSVLASYGMTSSATAALTGSLVYRETAAWSLDRQVLSFAISAVHCWGMVSLSLRGLARDSGDDTDLVNRATGPSIQMAEVPGRCGGATPASCGGGGAFPGGFSGGAAAAAASSGSRGANIATGGSSASGAPMAVVGAHDGQGDGPLLDFGVGPRTVDEDALIEDQLLARALAPQRLSFVLGTPLTVEPEAEGPLGGESLPWVAAWPDSGASGQALAWGNSNSSLQFDADFEEIMRRFDEDDKKTGAHAEQAINPSLGLAAPMPEAVVSTPSQGTAALAVPMDAQTMLDVSYGLDEEDQLLECIQDIDDL